MLSFKGGYIRQEEFQAEKTPHAKIKRQKKLGMFREL